LPLLARANPLATIPAAFLVGTLRAGGASLQFDTGIEPEIVDVLLSNHSAAGFRANIGESPSLKEKLKRTANVTSGWGS
jgi:general nucleoside transport system permease protein